MRLRHLSALLALLATLALAQSTRPRARDIGIAPGVYTPGPLNAITDVAGVRVGHVTLIESNDIRTGVTAIIPADGNVYQDKLPAAVFVGNAYGKLAGSTQVDELGTIETPIVLTNTLSVGPAVEALVAWTLSQPGNEHVLSINALVGETNDGRLNDIRGQHVRREHVFAALAAAKRGPVPEGSVGAGTGTMCFGWKGGIGTSSRQVRGRSHAGSAAYKLGVLVQTNYGGHLIIAGVPVWRELNPLARDSANGSCMIVVATDAPLTARDLKRLAARAVFGLARTGSSYANGSGDFAIAFSTAPSARLRRGAPGPRTYEALTGDDLNPVFEAVLEATEEAVDNSLLQATSVRSKFGSAKAIPVEKLKQVLAKYGVTARP